MKILYISCWFPYPPDNGARIRAYYLLKALAEKHDVYLISQLQEDSDPGNAKYLEEICRIVSLHPSRWFKPGTWKSIIGTFSTAPRSVVDTYDRNLAQAIRDAVESLKPDVIVSSTIGVAAYIPRYPNIITILDEHNCEHAILKRSAMREQNPVKRLRMLLGWKKAEAWETRQCKRFDCITIVTANDRDLLQKTCRNSRRIDVVPNGVDTDYYQPDLHNPSGSELIYNGALTYGANLDAVKYYISEIYPCLRKLNPSVVLKITGRNEGVDLSGISDCPGIRLTGYVSDIREELQSSSICVVPLRHGGGSRLKILEAMAAAVPVVSTSVGAEGLDVVDGDHLLIADSPEDFAKAINQLLHDSTRARKLSSNARSFVEAYYSWKSIGNNFVQIVESVAGSNLSVQ